MKHHGKPLKFWLWCRMLLLRCSVRKTLVAKSRLLKRRVMGNAKSAFALMVGSLKTRNMREICGQKANA